MPKEKPQPKNESQSLEMARRTLGPVKEMDLTPEEKAKVMAMIKEAQAAETAGNQSKALNIYTGLKKLLNLMERLRQGEVPDDPERIKKQLNIINAELKKRRSKKLVEALVRQKTEVEMPKKEKTRIISPEAEKNNHYISEFFTEKEIFEQIAKIEEFNDDQLYISYKEVDGDGKLIRLILYAAGEPQQRYIFTLGQKYLNDGVVETTPTGISKDSILIKASTTVIGKNILVYNFQEHNWQVLRKTNN